MGTTMTDQAPQDPAAPLLLALITILLVTALARQRQSRTVVHDRQQRGRSRKS